MCYVDVYEKQHVSITDDASSVGGRLIMSTPNRQAILSLGHPMNFIDNWLQIFEVNDQKIIMFYKIKMNEIFKTITK